MMSATGGFVFGPRAHATTSCAGTQKCYAASVSPGTVTSGSSDTFTLKLTNESPAASTPLGSVNLSAATGFTIKSTTQPACTALSVTECATIAGNVLELRNLNLQPQTSTSVIFSAGAPAVTGTYCWPAAAKQANAFNGTGNDFVLDPVNSNLTTTVAAPPPPPPASEADLSVTFPVASQPNPVTTGNDTLYTVKVTNTTPSGASATSTNVTLTDTVSSGSSIVQAPSSGTTSGWSCTTASATRSTCTFANLAAGASTTITVAAQAPGAAGSMSDSASVTSSATDPNAANNSATQSTTVATPPSNSNTATGFCPNTGCTVSSGREPTAANPTVARVAFPSFSGSGFTYSFSLGAGSFCSPTGGVSCTGDAVDLGNLLSSAYPQFTNANSPITVDVLYDSSITPGGVTTANAFKCTPSATNDCSSSSGQGTPILNCAITAIASPDPCVNQETRDSVGALDVQILMLSSDPKVGNLYIP